MTVVTPRLRRPRASQPGRPAVDLSTRVGQVALRNPVMTASGTAGHGAELSGYVDLAELGAVVVKSVSLEPWPGNPAPRLHPLDSGLLNSVGLQNPGLAAWLGQELPALAASGASVVASIWGSRADEYHRAAAELPPSRGWPAACRSGRSSAPM
jgi:dihydroorotate dehydrogenase (NAD+) catalytic subunit